jgi:hypothetical protein
MIGMALAGWNDMIAFDGLTPEGIEILSTSASATDAISAHSLSPRYPYTPYLSLKLRTWNIDISDRSF